MPSLVSTLADLLSQVRRPGDFCATGVADIHLPGLEVTGLGPVALPLLPAQAEQLIEGAERAPYGRGNETLVDTEVRRTWQLDAARVRIGGRRWTEDLAEILGRVTTALGVTGQVDAALYKLLVYDTGGFFVSHRDSEKAPGMFATLVVVLPSSYTGGELVIRHRNREVRLDLRHDEPSEVAYAAFYADCRHEVLPVVSGYRLALVYNLLRVGTGPLPQPPDYAPQQQRAAELLRAWGQGDPSPADGPSKLIYPLEHAYTQAELGFGSLKGADAAVAGVLVGAAKEADCDLHLALVSIEESGWAEYARGGRWRDPEYEIGEVLDDSRSVHDWRLPDGSAPEMGALPFEETEISPPGALADLDEIEPDFQEATGNEGVSFERFYQRAALVLWPRARRAPILAAGGLAVSVPFLSRLVARWEESGQAAGAEGWQEALALAASIRDAWPASSWERQQASKAGHGAALLESLGRLGDPKGAADFIRRQCAVGAYGPADNGALAALLARLAPGQAADLLTAVIAHNATYQPGACADLLARCAERAGDQAADLGPAALALIAGLPDGTGPTPMADSGLSERPTPELVAYALVALGRIEPAFADQALSHFLSLPAIYPMDDVLLPAALALWGAGPASGPGPIAELRKAVLAHLASRIAEPLEPPADWRRSAEIACTCTACRALSRFLDSPAEPIWRFKAAQAERSHVEDSIRRHRCDLELTTDKQGRPYALLCTKNQASFRRRVQQRERDLAHQERLLRGKPPD